MEYQREVKDRTILFSTDVLKSNKEVLKDLKKTFKGSMRNQKNPPKTPKNLTDLVRILVKTDTFMYALVVPKLSGIIHVEISNDFKTNHQLMGACKCLSTLREKSERQKREKNHIIRTEKERLFLSSLWDLSFPSSRPLQHLEEKNKEINLTIVIVSYNLFKMIALQYIPLWI